MRIIDGKKIAARFRDDIQKQVEKLKTQGLNPGLTVVIVGEDPASLSYVRGKEKACIAAGIESRTIRLPDSTPQHELVSIIDGLNDDPLCSGILVQLPLPKHIDSNSIINRIAPEKDVDGFHPVSLGRLLSGGDTFYPCTPYGIIKLLEAEKIPIAGKHAVIVGRSSIVGKPLANLLLLREYNATVTVCHTGTADMKALTLQADILIVAAGRPGMIKADMVKPGAAVVDVGVNRVADATRKKGYRLAGDVDFDNVKDKASAITPVPGGVGPMTITMLLYNTVKAAAKQAELAQGRNE